MQGAAIVGCDTTSAGRRAHRIPSGLLLVLLGVCLTFASGCMSGRMAPPPPLTAELIEARFGMGTVRSFDFSADRTLMAIGGDVGRIYLWDVPGQRFKAVTERGSPITAVRMAGQTVFAAARDGVVIRYDAMGRPQGAFGRKGSAVVSLAVTADGALAAAGFDNGHLMLWDGRTARQLADEKAHAGAVNGLAMTADGRALFTAGADGVVKAWTLPDLKLIKAAPPQKSPILSLAYSPAISAQEGESSAARLFVGCQDGGIRMIDVTTLSVVNRYNDLRGPVYTVAAAGPFLAGGSSDQKLALWDTSADHPVRMITGQQGTVYACVFSPDGPSLLAGGDAKIVMAHSLQANAHEEPREIGHPTNVLSVAFSPDNKWIASNGSGPDVLIWDTANRSLARLLHVGGQKEVQSVAWSSKGLLAAGNEDGSLRVFDEKGNNGLSGSHPQQVNDVEFSPDGTLLASAGWDDEIRLWKVPNPLPAGRGGQLETAGELKGHKNGVSAVAFSRDAKSLASSSWDQTARYWDVAARAEKMKLSGIAGPVFSVACGVLRPELVAGGWRGQTWVWDTNDGSNLFRKDAQTDVVFRVVFSPDGTRLASGSADRTVQIFDAEANMSPITRFAGFRGPVRGLSWSSKGDRLAIGTFDGNIFVLSTQESTTMPNAPNAPSASASPAASATP